jgi:hypothetical protein
MRTTQEAISAGNEEAAADLPELHATLSGMKAMGTVCPSATCACWQGVREVRARRAL